MLRFVKFAAVGIALSLLAACQTVSPALNNPVATTSLAAAGFEKTGTSDPSSDAYICQARCGGLVVIVRGSQQLASDPRTSLTVEDAIKSDAYKESGVKTLFSRFLNEQGGKLTLTSLRIDRRRAEVHLRFNGSSPGRAAGQGRALLVVRGNHLGGLVVIAESDARAQSYLRRQWVP